MSVKFKNGSKSFFSMQTTWFCCFVVALLLFHSENIVFAMDYFEINNPKFRPVQVGLAIKDHKKYPSLKTTIVSNLQKTLFFSVINETKKQFKNNGKSSYFLNLELKKSPIELKYSLWSKGKKTATFQGTLPLEDGENLRSLGLKMVDLFVETTLEFKGISKTHLAFTSQKGNRRKNIMLINYDGTNEKRFSYNLGTNNLASWSFDNQNILYTTFTRSSAQVAIQPTKRMRAQILTFPSGAQPLGGNWSPDGKSILLTLMKQGNADIYRYRIADAKMERMFAWKSLETSPVWSSDGKKIAFVSDSARTRQPQIYVHNLTKKKTERITFRGKYNSSPKWSPDGAQLLYERQIKGYFQIFKYTLGTRRHLQLTFARHDSEKPDWSPNGKQLVFAAKKKGISKLYYISSYGGRMIRVTKSDKSISETNPVWSK